MRTVTIQIPGNVELSEKELKFRVAARLYDERKVTLGEGAIIAEVSKRNFIEHLADVGVSVFNYDSDDLLEDIAHA